MIFRQQFTIETPVPAEEAWKYLLPVMKRDWWLCAQCHQPLAGAARFCTHCGLPVPPHTKPQFEGDISPQQFKITRIISYRNSCLPVIRGRFEPTQAGTRIVIDMKMHPLGWVLLIGFAIVSFVRTLDPRPQLPRPPRHSPAPLRRPDLHLPGVLGRIHRGSQHRPSRAQPALANSLNPTLAGKVYITSGLSEVEKW